MLTTALCPPCPATLPFGTSLPKQHRSNRFVHTLHTTAFQDGHDIHCSADFLFRYGQSRHGPFVQRVGWSKGGGGVWPIEQFMRSLPSYSAIIGRSGRLRLIGIESW